MELRRGAALFPRERGSRARQRDLRRRAGARYHRCATRYCRPRANSSRRRSPQASHAATITDATATPRGWCHSANRRRGTASDRALIGRFAGEPEQQSNLTLITGAHEARDPGRPAWARERYGRRVPHCLRRDGDRSRRQGGDLERRCGRLAAMLPLSGIGPRQELDAVGVPCLVDSPHLGKHLRAHLRHPISTSYCQQNHCPPPGAIEALGNSFASCSFPPGRVYATATDPATFAPESS